MNNLFSLKWWIAAGTRAANTALAAVLPLASLLVAGEVTPLYVLSLTALTVIGSLLTSAAGLPEVVGRTVPLWRAVIVRVLKTVGQVGVPAIGSVLVVEAVDWGSFGVTVGGAALFTLLRTLKDYLPEADDVPGRHEAV